MSNNQKTLDYVKEMENKVKGLNKRLKDECKDMNQRKRAKYSRDYARILYSASFRRLQGKMQLLGIQHTNFFRNRLTHSLEVAQIAKSIANILKLDDTYVVEACSLAHDLGNSPFGHAGEEILNDLALKSNIDGFEGNAQTFRILTKLEKKHHSYKGLNLTFRTLLGVIKYFNKFNYKESFEFNEKGDLKIKKFIYVEDYNLINSRLDKYNLTKNDVKTIDMQIMDLADEIAYAAHDLEDCLNMDLFSIDELLYEFKISDKYNSAYKKLKEIVNKCKKFARKSSLLNTSEEYSILLRKELTSRIVHKLINDIVYSEDEDKLQFIKYKSLAKGLKKLVFKLVLKKPFVQAYEKRGEKVIKGLFKVYKDEGFNKNLKFLSPEFRIYNNEKERIRNIIDFIAGMMDDFAIEEYKKYFGENSLNKLYYY